MAEMTPRRRVHETLHHQEPDRVPLDVGSGTSNSLLIETYENLKAFAGITAPTCVMAQITRVAQLDEGMLVRLGSDMRPIRLRGPQRWVAPATEPIH